MRFAVEISGLGALREFAERLAGVFRAGDIVILSGELGAGKTTLVRAVSDALGVDVRSVSSPTFVIMNEYAARGGLRVIHADAYRVRGEDEFEAAGFDAARADDAVTLVEWGERVAPALGPAPARLTLRVTGETTREIALDLPESWAAREGIGALGAQGGCPVTGEPVGPDSPAYPFSSERARLADLHRWLSGSYRIGRDDTADEGG